MHQAMPQPKHLLQQTVAMAAATSQETWQMLRRRAAKLRCHIVRIFAAGQLLTGRAAASQLNSA